MGDEPGIGVGARGRRPGRPSPAGNTVAPPEVTRLFGRIAPVYDRLNTVMTLGADQGWRRAAARACGLVSGGQALDVACGTGKLTVLLAAAVGPTGRVVGLDASEEMLEIARRQSGAGDQVVFVRGDALALPFADGTFDAAAIAFGLRNLADYRRGLAEMARVVRPGGRVVCLELTHPRPRLWAALYRAAFRRWAPAAGRLAGVAHLYQYLPESLDRFPDAPALAQLMTSVGLVAVRYRRLGLGTVALHVGEVPR